MGEFFPGFHSLGVNCGGGVQEGGKTLLRACKHPSASDKEDVEPPGAVWLDDHCYLWVGDEVGQVGGDDEGGEGVLGVGPVPPLLLLLNVAREEQGRHTAGYQTAPVWFLWQITHCLLPSPVFAQKGRGRWWQPRRGQCRRCELEDESGHWGTQCKSGKLSSCSGGNCTLVGGVWSKVMFLLLFD